ncbi:MAG: RHS repeat-associated core domain-containing protein, partial [Candidatus Limnocylindria bacterium]
NPAIRYVSDVALDLPVTIDDGTRKYIYGLGLAYTVSGSALKIYHLDRLSSVRVLTDIAGAITDEYRADEWGVPMQHVGSSPQPFGFTGEPVDATSLMYLRARYYSPGLARFTSRDAWPGLVTILQTLNRFSYVSDNPVMYRDPSGHAALDILDLGFGPAKTDQRPAPPPPPRNVWEPEYCDFNVTAGALGVVTLGYMWDDSGGHFYLGGGIGLGASAAITCSADSISPGWNYGIQGSYVISYQGGGTLPENVNYHEWGLGWPPGGAVTFFHVW